MFSIYATIHENRYITFNWGFEKFVQKYIEGLIFKTIQW